MPNQKNQYQLANISVNLTPIFNMMQNITLIEQIRKQTTPAEKKNLLKILENIWILKLKTLYRNGLNQGFNDIH